MHLFDSDKYTNLLYYISLSSNEIREAISLYRLEFPQERNQVVEWKMKLPAFVDTFYNTLIVHKKVPSQKEFIQNYFVFNKSFFEQLNRSDLESGIKARAARTYPSLVRDIYFNQYISEHLGTKCQVIYNTKLDIEEGIDLMIITRKNNYGICFFTQTQRGFIGRTKKTSRHTKFDNVKYIEMPLDFKGSVKAGEFFLYGEKEFNYLCKTLIDNGKT